MDRTWYLRFGVVVASAILAVLALLPSLEPWVSTPGWVRSVFSERISPGLDIQGGLRLMYEVEVDEAIRDRRDRLGDQLLERLGEELGVLDEDEASAPTREQLDEVRDKVKLERVGERQIRATFTEAGDADELDRGFLQEHFPALKVDGRQGGMVTLIIRDDFIEELEQNAVDQVKTTVSERIDELGLKETTVIAKNTDLIVEIPGAGEASFERTRAIISRTAQLTFQVLDDESSFFADLTDLPEGIEKSTEAASAGESRPSVTVTYLLAEGEGARQRLKEYVASLDPPEGREILLGRANRGDEADGEEEGGAWRTYLLDASVEVTGEDIEDAFVAYDQQAGGQPYVAINFNAAGATGFERLTGRNVKRRMAIVLDDRVESAPVIQTRIGGGRARIQLGAYMDPNALLKEASDLSLVLRAGALPAPIRPANEQLIGPTLGRDSVVKGAQGALIGVALVLVFMLIYYQVAGIVADLMVVLNLLFLLSLLSAFGATLTLPGIAGIALTTGMAVDANVLITERIREELRLGKSPRSAVDQGYGRAFWSIIDSQLTTFIAGVVLLQYGTGPIKGFATTLLFGILTSLFTGVFCSKVFLDFIVRGLRVQRFRVG